MFITPDALLDAMKKNLRGHKPDSVIEPFLGDLQPVMLRDGLFVLETFNPVLIETLNTQFKEICTEILSFIIKEPCTPLFVFGDDADYWRKEANDHYVNYTFDHYVVGTSNRYAYMAAKTVAENPGKQYNPLLIYGGSGLGKTHLLFAIGNHVRKQRSQARIVYIKSEDFMNELVEAIRTGFAEFRAKYRRADLLLVDDIQFMAGKTQMQEEFFNTFESLHQAGKQMVFTSDRPPKEIATLSERLTSRFEMGILADIQSPDLETRIALVHSKAEIMGLSLPPEVINFVASSITNNVREIEGTLRNIAAMHTLMEQDVDLALAQEAIKDIFKERPGLNPTAELILEEVATFFDMTPESIIAKGRAKDVLLPRRIAIYLMREMTPLSLPAIGSAVAQNHSTVLYSIRSITDSLVSDTKLQAMINDLKNNIKSR